MGFRPHHLGIIIRALLDGDIYAFRSAASAENEDLGIAIARCEDMIDNTLAETDADEFSIYLSGANNFRYDIYPEYKANRTSPKPRWLKDVKDYLIENYSAEVSDGCEADDLLGIAQCATLEANDGCAFGLYNENPTIICSLDKDLRMIPGQHYSFEISGASKGTKWVRPSEIVTVTPEEGLKRFYTQILTGDTTDNVKGASGIGPKKAAAILADKVTEQELYEAVEVYFSPEELLMTGRCLWIFRKPNDIWELPRFETSEQ